MCALSLKQTEWAPWVEYEVIAVVIKTPPTRGLSVGGPSSGLVIVSAFPTSDCLSCPKGSVDLFATHWMSPFRWASQYPSAQESLAWCEKQHTELGNQD
jgi:hypothetical protein